MRQFILRPRLATVTIALVIATIAPVAIATVDVGTIIVAGAVYKVAGAGGIALRELGLALVLEAVLPSVAIGVGDALHAAAFGHLFWDIIAWDIAWDIAPSRVPIYPWHLSDQVPQVAYPVLAALAVRIGQTTLPLAFALPCRKKYVRE